MATLSAESPSLLGYVLSGEEKRRQTKTLVFIILKWVIIWEKKKKKNQTLDPSSAFLIYLSLGSELRYTRIDPILQHLNQWKATELLSCLSY